MDKLEFLRRSVALCDERWEHETILVDAAEIKKDKRRLFCSCMRGKRYADCDHARQLLAGHGQLVEHCGGADLPAILENTAPGRLLAPLYALRKPKGSRCRTERQQENTWHIDNGGAELYCVVAATTAFMERLTGRLGVAGAEQWRRSHLIGRCRDFHLSDTERALAGGGVASGRIAQEDCLWYRLAYHLFAETTAKGQKLCWQISSENGARPTLAFFSADKSWRVTILLPDMQTAEIVQIGARLDRKRCAITLDQTEHRLLFRLEPLENDLHALKTLIAPADGASDPVHLDPGCIYGQHALLSAASHLVRLDRRSLQACAAKIPWTPPLDSVQAAELLESKGELFSDEPAVSSAQTDLFGATPKAVARLERLIWPPRVSSFDSLEFEPVGADEHSVVVRARYCSGSGSAEMTQIDTARKANRRYLLGKGILVDLAHDSIASLALLPCDSDQDGVRLSRIDFLQFRESGVALKIVGSNRFSKDLRMLLEIRPHKPWSAPRGFLSQLREYQERGVEWMLFLQENGFGGLLCDEMGLGKTHQALALIASLRESSPAGKGASLVVCPSSVMGHWEQLASRFAPELSTAIYHGGKRDLDTLLGNNIALLITSYGILRNDSAELWSRRWNAAIFDEIQQCKTRSTEVFKAAQGCSAGVRLGLTGTPVENSLSDIKSLFDIVLPGYLGSDTDFVDRFLRPIEDGQSVAAKSRFRRMIGPFILRRLKKGVARELPEKIEDTRICQLGPQQQRLYKNLHQKEGVGLISQLRDREQPVPYMHILGLLVKMKQLCDHPRLIDPSCDSADCPKFELLCELIDESLESGEKVVVFSQFLDMIDLIAAYLAEKTIGHVVLTGATTNRTALINRFAADPECKVFVASLLAGGTGIDLSAASVVIHYDRWWTAAREDQATDRVHRIGQTRGVQVFKFITSATIEERIELIINRKRTLANDALTIDSPDGIKTFTREDLLELLEIGKDYTGN